MLKPLEMSKIVIIGPDTAMEKAIAVLHNMNVLHILDHKKEELDIGTPFENANKLSELLVKTKSITSQLGIEEEDIINLKVKKQNLNKIEKEMIKIEKEVNKVIEELKDTVNVIKEKQELVNKLELIKPLDLNIESYSGYKTISNFTGYMDKIGEFLHELKKITTRYSIKKTIGKKKRILSLFVENKDTKQIQDLLNKYGFSSLDLSSISEFKGDVNKYLLKLNKEITSLINKKKSLEKNKQKINKKNSEQLLSYKKLLEEDLEKAEAPLRFAKTKDTFMINGWLPTKKVKKTTEALEKTLKKKVFIQVREVDEDENIPVQLENPKAAKPFEFFMDLYALPKYNEIDPTFFVFLTFPLLFGFMLGDFGYGLITLALVLILKKRFPSGERLFKVMTFAAVSTIFFGLLFGEFFGFEVLFGYHLPNILSRAHQVNTLIIISIAFGVVHINWGIITGFYNILRQHGIWHAVTEKLSWIILEIGVALIALSYLNILNMLIFGYVLIGLAVVLLYIGEGVKGLVELPSIFTNIFSYIRLMAIGLASVQLAILINEFAIEFIHKGTIIGVISAVLIIVIGHVINLVVGLIGSFLHSLRLHYVEFFGKFFEGGAIRYKPFGEK